MEPHFGLLLALVLGAAAVDVSGSNEVENVQNSVLQRRLSRDRRNASDYQTHIEGGDMQWIDSYTTLVLTCTVSRPELAEAPEYISWYHNSVIITHWDDRVNIEESLGESKSTLRLHEVGPMDSGNYTCAPHHSPKYTTVVYIIEGYPTMSKGNIGSPLFLLLLAITILAAAL